jgi:hypothetical protein
VSSRTTFPNEIVAIDLLDISDLHRFNSFYKWILLLVDTFSRFLWAYKLKNKTARAVALTLDEHFSNPQNRCSKLWGDRDKSFYAAETKRVLDKYGIKLYSTSSPLKSVFAETYIRLFKSKLYRYFTYNKTKKWIDVIDKIVYGMNNTQNNVIGMKPSEVTEQNSSIVWKNIYARHVSEKFDIPKFKVKDLVRITTDRSIFSKRYKAIWTEEVFQVREVIQGKPTTYKLEDLNSESISGTFYDFEITKVSSISPTDL